MYDNMLTVISNNIQIELQFFFLYILRNFLSNEFKYCSPRAYINDITHINITKHTICHKCAILCKTSGLYCIYL